MSKKTYKIMVLRDRAALIAERTARLAEWKQRIDYGRRYVRWSVAFQADGKVTAADLYTHHQAWCHNEGLQPLPKNMLGKKMAQAGYTSTVVKVGNRPCRIYRVRLLRHETPGGTAESANTDGEPDS